MKKSRKKTIIKVKREIKALEKRLMESIKSGQKVSMVYNNKAIDIFPLGLDFPTTTTIEESFTFTILS